MAFEDGDIPLEPTETAETASEKTGPDEAVIAKNLGVSAALEPRVQLDEGIDVKDAGVTVSPPTELVKSTGTTEASEAPSGEIVEGEILGPQQMAQEELNQDHQWVIDNIAEHRAGFSGKIVESEATAEPPREETTQRLVRTVNEIVENRPPDDSDRGEVTDVPGPPEDVKEIARNTHFERDPLRGDRIFAEVSCQKSIADKPEKSPADKLDAPAAAVKGLFAHDERFAATERAAKDAEEKAVAAQTLGAGTVVRAFVEGVTPTPPTEQETTAMLLERLETGELFIDEVIERRLVQLSEECEFPFKQEATLIALYILAEKLYPYLAEYDRIVIDDTSGRVPGLIYRQLINEARTAAERPPVKTIFVNGGSPFIGNFSPPLRGGLHEKTLIFTEFSQSFATAANMHDALKRHEPAIHMDIAAVTIDYDTIESFRETFPDKLPYFFVGFVEGKSTSLFTKDTPSRYKGVVKQSADVHASRAYRQPGDGALIKRARQDARHIAEAFSKLLDISMGRAVRRNTSQ